MAIRFSCPTCSKTLAVADDKAGVKVACPGCKNHLRVPANGQAGSDDGHPTKSASAASAGAGTASGKKTSRGAGTHVLSEWGQIDAALGDAVEVLDRDLSKQEEAQIRTGLTAYADAVPHHDLRGLGKKVTITRVRELRSYRVVLDSLYEKRHVARKEEPFQGGDVPPTTTTEQNIQVWSYAYATASDFQKATAEHRIGDSQQVVVCRKCGGQTITECAACSASGVVTCSACSGSGRAGRCPLCRGKGEVKERRDVPPQWEICRACTGGVAVGGGVCSICNGTGMAKHHYYQERVIPCGSCFASGKAVCTSCGGNGRVRCPKCGGAGKTPCSTCKATGKTLSYLCVVQSFDVSTETISVPSSEVEAGVVTAMIQPSDYATFLTLTTTDLPTGLTLASGPKQLRGAVTKACDTAQARVSQESRLMRQRLQVGVASILEVGYQHDGKEYTAWFVGKHFHVHAPVSPITDALQQTVKQAVKTWRKGDSKEATLLLREVMDMAGADPHCNAAYEEVRDAIPADLESKARWVRWKPYIVAGAVAFGVVFLIGLVGVGYALFRAKSAAGRPGGVPLFVNVEQPGGQPPAFRPQAGGERLAVVQFLDRSVSVAKSGKATVRLRIQRVGQVEGDLTLKLEAPRGLAVPPQLIVEQGRQEVEIGVTAGDEAGVFTIRAVPVDFNGGPLAAECRVTVGGPGLPALPGR